MTTPRPNSTAETESPTELTKTPTRKPALRRRWWIAGGILALLVCLVAAVPFVARNQVENWLIAQGATNAQVGSISINPFLGRVKVRDVQAGEDSGAVLHLTRLEAQLQLGALFKRRLLLEQVRLQGLDADVREDGNGGWLVGALHFPATTAASEAAPADDTAVTWGVGIDAVELSEITVRFEQAALRTQLALTRLDAGPFATWAPDADTGLTVDIHIDGARLQLQGKARPLAASPQFAARVSVQELSLAQYLDLVRQSAGDNINLAGLVSLTLELDAKLVDGDMQRLQASGHGELQLADLVADYDDIHVTNQALNWQGSVLLDGSALQANTARLTLNAMLVKAAARQSVSLASLEVSEAKLEGTRDLSIAMVQLDRLQVNELAADYDDIHITNQALNWQGSVQLDGSALQANTTQLTLNSMLVKTAARQLVSLASLTVNEAKLMGTQNLGIAMVQLDSLQLALQRNAKGQLVLPGLGEAAPAAEQTPAQATADAGTDTSTDAITATSPETETGAFAFRIDTLRLGGDSRITFNDDFVKPRFATVLAPISLELNGFNNAESAAPAQINASLVQNEVTQITLSGTLHSFTQQADLKLVLEDLDLPQFSVYIPGYDLHTGRLGLESTIHVDGDQLDVQNTVLAERLAFSGRAGEAVPGFAQGLAMPLDMALDFLRDTDDNIRLKVPVTGLLSDPQFDTGDLVRLAMRGALKKAALSYVKNALQPLGTIMMVAEFAGEAAKPRFAPVIFAAGAAELSADNQAYLDKLAKLLAERPALSVTVCGIATQADVPADAPATIPAGDTGEAIAAPAQDAAAAEAQEEAQRVLEQWRLTLAESRALAVRRYLTSSRSIAGDRLFACRAKVAVEADAEPRVALKL